MSLYDEVSYEGHPFAQTHPDRMSTIAALFGLGFAAIGTCRVLELGCGDGGNLIPMAVELPGARFIGVDLAEKPIATGSAVVAALGLGNIELRAGDLREIDASWGEFDYIIAHGLYSWTPEGVRDRILGICGENLAGEGVAFVSYNALPGGRVRQMLREMMLFHVAEFADPRERIEQARALMGFVGSARVRPGAFHRLVEEEAERMLAREAGGLFHDELAEVYEPVYFHEFVGHAERHGLQYLGEASLGELRESGMTAEATATLEAIAGDDRILREQYGDFARCRRFRQTLLCREGRVVEYPPRAERVLNLWASTAVVRVGEDEFAGPEGLRVRTADPEVNAMLDVLMEAAPEAVSFEELEVGAELLLMTAVNGLTELHTARRALRARAGVRPVASALARYQAARGEMVATLHHASLRVEDAVDRALIGLLDGSRTLAELGVFPELEERLKRLGRWGVLAS